MALANLAALLAKIDQPDAWVYERYDWGSISGTPAYAPLISSWFDPGQIHPPTLTAPTTATAATDSSGQGVRRIAVPGADTFVTRVSLNSREFTYRTAILWDILNVQGGLDMTVTSAQTTNLPTAALTRYTTGEGVLPVLVIAADGGQTNATFSFSYTNQAGTSGRTGQFRTSIDTASLEPYPQIEVMYLPVLQDGDTGCRSVESLTLSASTGTAVDAGIWLMKPLAMFPIFKGYSYTCFNIIGWNNAIDQNACLRLTQGLHAELGVESGFDAWIELGLR